MRQGSPAPYGAAAGVAFGCGLVFTALFLVDVTALAVSALRPENMAADPELAVALRDFELLAMGSYTCSGPAPSSPPKARSPRTASWASMCRSWRWRAGS
jgi:hypothetical protein